MRMSSTLANAALADSTVASVTRRKPQQARASARRARFLEVAARLIGEQGFEAVTMTAIAAAAEASIGTLYDYFPDKRTLGLALMKQYASEVDAHWASFLRAPEPVDDKAFADRFVDIMLAFLRERPAYLPLVSAALGYSRTAAARQPLRRTIAGALQARNAGLTDEQAYLAAQIVVEMVKGLVSVYKQTAVRGREAVVVEFKRVLRLYVGALG